ncbi:MAG: lysozyme inhibitor LprI family protein [Filomicrobium sp.]
MRTLAILAFSMLAMNFTSTANAQGFDCRDRLSPDEETICESEVLQRLDDELNEIYEDALAYTSDDRRDRLRDEQRSWIETRGNCRRRENCIEQLYRDRIAELEQNYRDRRRDRREVHDGNARWSALGVVEADRRYERLVIPVGFSKGRFDALQFRVRDARVRVRSIVVRYGNGQRHRMRFRRTFYAGEISDLLELRPAGRGRFIDRIIIKARTRGFDGRRARVEVAGRLIGRGIPRGGPFAREYDPELDRKYSRGDREYGSGDSERREYGRADDPDREYGGNADDSREYGRRDGGNYGEGEDYDRLRRRYENDDTASLDRDNRRTWDLGNDEDNDRRDSLSIDDQLLDFIKNEFHRTAEMSPSELRRTYAPRVDYYGDDNKSISAIIKDKQNYGERWSDRAFRVDDGTLKVRETRSRNIYDVTYRYDFHVRGDGRESRGRGETTLRIDTNGDRFVILSENGKVLKRY